MRPSHLPAFGITGVGGDHVGVEDRPNDRRSAKLAGELGPERADIVPSRCRVLALAPGPHTDGLAGRVALLERHDLGSAVAGTSAPLTTSRPASAILAAGANEHGRSHTGRAPSGYVGPRVQRSQRGLNLLGLTLRQRFW